MRVYEYAKQHKLTSKQLLKKLEDLGFHLTTHMAQLPEEAVEAFEAELEKKANAHKKAALKPKKKENNHKVSYKPRVTVEEGDDEDDTETPKKAFIPHSVASKREHNKRVTPVVAPRPAYKPRRSKPTVQLPATEITIMATAPLSVGDLAAKLVRPVTEIIGVLLRAGMMRNVNALVTPEEVALVCEKLGVTVHLAQASQSTTFAQSEESLLEGTEKRLPIVVVMGHVDHGKTTLLDYLRKTNVVAKEKGGITQHLAAYEVQAGKSSLIFLDTPGHEAFTSMRTKGTQITDLVVIIVAANDGVKPQTIEAITLAQKANLPIVVAFNKIDKIASLDELEPLRMQLHQHGLTPEEWGGSTVCVPLCAKTGEGVSDLLDMLSLHAEMLDLTTDSSRPGNAFVLEVQQIKGHGWAATIIGKEGTIKVGDYFVCGSATGRVRVLIDSFGNRIDKVGPSVPAQLIGFDTGSGMGDTIRVVAQEEYRQLRSQKPAPSVAPIRPVVTSQELIEEIPVVRIILRADTQGSCQALSQALTKVAQDPTFKAVHLEILSNEVGEVSEYDVERAIDMKATIFGLHTKAERKALALAKEKQVYIALHDIIYHLVEEVEALMKKNKKKVITFVPVGKAEVLKTFQFKQDTIAGCVVTEGIVKKGDKVVCLRNGRAVGESIIKSLQREKRTVKEVREHQEFGFITESFNGWMVGDEVEVFTQVEQEL